MFKSVRINLHFLQPLIAVSLRYKPTVPFRWTVSNSATVGYIIAEAVAWRTHMRRPLAWFNALLPGIALGAPTAFADEGKNESGQRERREGRDKDRDKESKHD
jgi:hypothetical protein